MLDLMIVMGIFWIPLLFMKISKVIFGLSESEARNDEASKLAMYWLTKNVGNGQPKRLEMSREQVAGGIGFFAWVALVIWKLV